MWQLWCAVCLNLRQKIVRRVPPIWSYNKNMYHVIYDIIYGNGGGSMVVLTVTEN